MSPVRIVTTTSNPIASGSGEIMGRRVFMRRIKRGYTASILRTQRFQSSGGSGCDGRQVTGSNQIFEPDACSLEISVIDISSIGARASILSREFFQVSSALTDSKRVTR